MTTIQKASPYATLINVFTVEPDRTRALTELLTIATDEVVQHLPGFVPGSCAVSTSQGDFVSLTEDLDVALTRCGEALALYRGEFAADLRRQSKSLSILRSGRLMDSTEM